MGLATECPEPAARRPTPRLNQPSFPPAGGKAGSREACVDAALAALRAGDSVLIDRTHTTPVSLSVCWEGEARWTWAVTQAGGISMREHQARLLTSRLPLPLPTSAGPAAPLRLPRPPAGRAGAALCWQHGWLSELGLAVVCSIAARSRLTSSRPRSCSQAHFLYLKLPKNAGLLPSSLLPQTGALRVPQAAQEALHGPRVRSHPRGRPAGSRGVPRQ